MNTTSETEDFIKSIDISYKKEIFNKIIEHLENINRDNEFLSFIVKDINDDKNNSFILKNYPYLRKHFKLPHHSRMPKKLTSQTLLSMFKECNMKYKKKTKAYKIGDFKTTTGFYEVCV